MRDVGVEPRRYAHHVRFALQDRLPGFVAGGVLVSRAVGPGVPGKGSIDLVGGEAVSLQTGPGRHEEASSRCFDGGPIAHTVGSLKGRDERLPVVAVLGWLGFISVDVLNDVVVRPRPVREEVEGEKHAEVANGTGGLVSVVQRLVHIAVQRCDVQRESIDVGGFGHFDVLDPVVISSGSGIANLSPGMSMIVSTSTKDMW